jgi:hypothetical protein
VLIFSIATCAVVALAGVLFLLFMAGFPSFATTVTVSELSSNPERMLGVRVRVQGELEIMMFIPEEVPPYSYAIMDPATHKYVGVVWPYGDLARLPFENNITAIGMIVQGKTSGLMSGRTVYYLRADSIEAS